MEHFIVSALKYRPQTFNDVVGQKAITNTLQNAIDNNHLAQAMLFTGPRGVGKTTCARILAKMINKTESTSENEDFSFNIFELDAASNNSVDDIRSLTDQVRIPPQIGRYKVYIIDEVHMLSQAAFNAFLKTLEEPPAHCIFILATTEKHKIIPTILSRCQIFDFKRISVNDAKDYLKYIASEQEVVAEDDALHIIAQKADGAMRDALSIFDRIVTFTGKHLTRQAVTENLNILDHDTFFEATTLILENNIPQLLVQFNTTISKGFDGQNYIVGLASHFRDLLVSKTPETVHLIEVGETTKGRYLEQANHASHDFLIQAISLANSCDLNYKNSKNQRLLVELCLMQIASITFDGEKKNAEHYIIPPSFFNTTGTQPINANSPNVSNAKTNVSPVVKDAFKTEDQNQKVSENQEPIEINEIKESGNKLKRNVNSGLSLKSIQAKKDLLANQNTKQIDASKLPVNSFTYEAFLTHWNAYIAKLEKNGAFNLASILKIDTPKINTETIILKLPNDTNRVEIERAQTPLLNYLRKQLNNFNITIELTVDKKLQKKFVYTTKEKFDKLVELNPDLDYLRKTFDLDI